MDALVQLLADTQLAEQAPRIRAEQELKAARSNTEFSRYLAHIASSSTYPTAIRQSSLTVLRGLVKDCWTGDADSQTTPDHDPTTPHCQIPETIKQEVRSLLLELAIRDEDDKKVKGLVSYSIGKIASTDFPDQWPDLLTKVLDTIRNGTDFQLHGALKVLSDLVEECLDNEQFFQVARDVITVLYQVALNENRTISLRALAVKIFRSSFDMMEMVKDDHLAEVKTFANEALEGWLPFFHQVIKLPLDARSPENGGSHPATWNGIISLKLQCVKTLSKIKSVFASLLLPQSFTFFQETWTELAGLTGAYVDEYIQYEAQCRLEDADGLPYTLDFLILEELDFLNQCMRAGPVQKQLAAELKASEEKGEASWMAQLMNFCVAYSCIVRETEELWDIDVSLYIAEETSVSANYTARTACGDLLIKISEWLGPKALQELHAHTNNSLFVNQGADWRTREAALYLFNQLAIDLDDRGKTVPPEICQAYLAFCEHAANDTQPLLKARGYLVAGTLSQSYPPAVQVLDHAIIAMNQSDSELVQIACVKAVETFVKSRQVKKEHQLPILQAIDSLMSSRSFDDEEECGDLLVTFAETLRAAINLDPTVVIQPPAPSLNLLFIVGRYGADNFQAVMLINETIEEVVRHLSQPDPYAQLCQILLPILNGFFVFGDMSTEQPLVTLATEIIAILVKYGPEPLPAGFVATVVPKLKHILLESNEGEILRAGAEALKYILMHDHQHLFEWQDDAGNSGLAVCLLIIDRLLGPDIEDNSASEVGGLAAELVEKAGHQRLGNGMLERLLQAVAMRLSSAQAAPFIQSLILVFARLCLNAAGEVVGFLSQITIQLPDGSQDNGLSVVLSKWLENSINFAGYDEIRQNVIALSKLFALNDPGIEQTNVKGSLIIPASDAIMTRSRAKQNPDQYTIIPAPLKILKVLIEELLSAQGKLGTAAMTAAAAIRGDFDDEDDGDEGWEDDPDAIQLSLGQTKEGLLSYLEASTARQKDDETQDYLTSFFMTAARENTANFNAWYERLDAEEKVKLQELEKVTQ